MKQERKRKSRLKHDRKTLLANLDIYRKNVYIFCKSTVYKAMLI